MNENTLRKFGPAFELLAAYDRGEYSLVEDEQDFLIFEKRGRR